MKLMALDFGTKRVGVASTDEAGEFAIPRAVWSNDESLLGKVIDFYHSEKIEKLILGESKDLTGEANPVMEDIKKFKESLEKEGIEVVYHPEILTTREARQIQGNTDMTDASAASLILKSYIDSQ